MNNKYTERGQALVSSLIAVILILIIVIGFLVYPDSDGISNPAKYDVSPSSQQRAPSASVSLTDQFNNAIYHRDSEAIRSFFDICSDDNSVHKLECRTGEFLPLVDQNGWTPLMYAAYVGDAATFRLVQSYFSHKKSYIENLLGERFRHLHYQAPEGESVHLIAAYLGWSELVESFSPIELILQNKSGVSVMDVVRETGNSSLEDKLDAKESEAWREVQQVLRRLGNYEGEIDGIVGKKTKLALMEALERRSPSERRLVLDWEAWKGLQATTEGSWIFAVEYDYSSDGKTRTRYKGKGATRKAAENKIAQECKNKLDCKIKVLTNENCAYINGNETGQNKEVVFLRSLYRALNDHRRDMAMNNIVSWGMPEFKRRMEENVTICSDEL